MPQLLNLGLDIISYNSNSQTNDPSDSIRISNNSLTGQTINATSRQIITLPANGSLQSVSLPASPTNLLIIFSDQQFSYSLNSGATVTVVPLLAGVKQPLLLFMGAVTTLSVQAGTVNADIDLWMVA